MQCVPKDTSIQCRPRCDPTLCGISFGPRCGKTCLRGFRQRETKTSLLSYRDKLENWNLACSKLRNGSFQNVNNKGADQTVWMCRLACVVRKPSKTGFLASGPISYQIIFKNSHCIQKVVCACVVRKPLKTGFLASGPISYQIIFKKSHCIQKVGHETLIIYNRPFQKAKYN